MRCRRQLVHASLLSWAAETVSQTTQVHLCQTVYGKSDAGDVACKIRRVQNKSFKNRESLLQTVMKNLNDLSELDNEDSDRLQEQENIIVKFQEHADTAMKTVATLQSTMTILEKEVCALKNEELASKNIKITQLEKQVNELQRERDNLRNQLKEKDREREKQKRQIVQFM